MVVEFTVLVAKLQSGIAAFSDPLWRRWWLSNSRGDVCPPSAAVATHQRWTSSSAPKSSTWLSWSHPRNGKRLPFTAWGTVEKLPWNPPTCPWPLTIAIFIHVSVIQTRENLDGSDHIRECARQRNVETWLSRSSSLPAHNGPRSLRKWNSTAIAMAARRKTSTKTSQNNSQVSHKLVAQERNSFGFKPLTVRRPLQNVDSAISIEFHSYHRSWWKTAPAGSSRSYSSLQYPCRHCWYLTLGSDTPMTHSIGLSML